MIQVSSKVIHSIITFSREKGLLSLMEELATEIFSYPLETLQEPDIWLQATQVETFLGRLQEKTEELSLDMVSEVGEQVHELKAWGALDDVLTLMGSMEAFYQHPESFLAFFLKPKPLLKDLSKDKDSITFTFPISSQDFPFLTHYFRSVLKNLPRFIGRPPVQLRWKDDDTVTIHWGEKQCLLSEEPEKFSQEWSNLKRKLLEKTEELNLIKKSIKSSDHFPSDFLLKKLNDMKDSFLISHDYLLRIEQLLTCLSEKKDPQFEEIQNILKQLQLQQLSDKRINLHRQFKNSYEEIQNLLTSFKEEETPTHV